MTSSTPKAVLFAKYFINTNGTLGCRYMRCVCMAGVVEIVKYSSKSTSRVAMALPTVQACPDHFSQAHAHLPYQIRELSLKVYLGHDV